MDDIIAHRLDAFTDAAFAFAVTLLVIGAGGNAGDTAALVGAIASIPAFAIGFIFLAMFWYTHVRWRKVRGAGDWRSVALTLLLVFLVLIYVVPLRAMAASLAYFISGIGPRYAGGIGQLFQIYGVGFVAMSGVTVALFSDALRNPALDAAARQRLTGEIWIWTLLVLTGIVSTVLASIPGTMATAPFVYATLPVTIGLFSWRWRWNDQSVA